MAEKYLTPREAADFLGYQRTTLANWRSKGVGPEYTKYRRSVLYRESDLIVWVRSNSETVATNGEH